MPANKRELRTRIKSVKNTQQITRAQQMVAAAKVRRAQDRVAASKPFAAAIADVFRQVGGQLPKSEFRSPLLETRPFKRVALIVVTSDRGLCGGYNSNVLRLAVQRHRFWKDQGVDVSLIIIGQKGASFFRHSNFNVAASYTQVPQVPTFAQAQAIVADATRLYGSADASQTVDNVELIYTNFRSMVTLVPTNTTLLPAAVPAAETGDKAARAQYVFEPDAASVMERIIPKYLQTLVYQALLESAASELAAKMTAMSAASKNAKELAAALTLVYNKARQASITQEILEVVGGANS